MSRGNGQQDVFRGDADRQDFIKTLAETCEKTGFRVHAYCLMRNHFHLVAETPNANLVAGMKWFLSTYTIRFNHRHKRIGHVFSGRYKALIVDGSGNGYLRMVCDYVHLNPVRARLLKPEQRLREYPWSSFDGYLAVEAPRPEWLRVDRLLGEHGIHEDTAAGRRQFERRMEARRTEDAEGAEERLIRRGWCLGPPDFKARLLEQMDGRLGEYHSGELKRESAEAKAERIIREELTQLRWTEADLKQRAKNDPAKLALAARVRRETTLTIRWIAGRLHLGSWKSLNANLHRWQGISENGRK